MTHATEPAAPPGRPPTDGRAGATPGVGEAASAPVLAPYAPTVMLPTDAADRLAALRATALLDTPA